MKKAFKPALFVLLMCGVFGADEDEVESVSVMEGDSVTLNPNQTQIQRFNRIEWRLEDQLIASFDRSKTKYPYERFGDRLKLNQTGSLTITNMKTKHSGLYKLQIDLNSGTVHVHFTVTVYVSPSVIDAGKAEMKSVSVKEGDRVTLQTGVTQISGEELMVWRFGDEGKLIAKADIEAKSSPLYYDERFRNSLENQTGSLIITNTRSTDSGLYTVKISSNKQTLYKRFTVTVIVTVSGLSPGAVAGIVVAVLLVLAVVVAAAAAGFIYQRRKISELRKQILTVTVTVSEGDDVTLKPNKTIKKGNLILWMFGEEETQTSIAKFTRETGEIVTHDYAADGRFRDRLKLDTTGYLTIRNSRPEHSGHYTLYIRSSSGDSQQRFIIIVKERVEVKSVEEGDTVTLKPDTEIQEDEEMLWMLGDQDVLIAQIRGQTGEICTYDAAAGRFRGRLKLEKTGSLTITNITAADTGIYTLQTITSRGILFKRFWVYIPLKRVSVTAGESVHLSTDRPKIERDDVIEWRCGDEIIAVIKEGTGKTHDGAAERFRARLQLDDQTGDLTINDPTAEDAGRYKLKIRSRKGNRNKNYMVIITGRDVYVYVTVGESVHLSTDRPKIERDDVIQWMFGDKIIAEIKGGTGETHDGADERFRDRLQLNDRTGDLTIKNFTAEDTGRYKLKIRRRKGDTNKTYRVIIPFAIKPRKESSVKGNNDESVVEMQPLMT